MAIFTTTTRNLCACKVMMRIMYSIDECAFPLAQAYSAVSTIGTLRKGFLASSLLPEIKTNKEETTQN